MVRQRVGAVSWTSRCILQSQTVRFKLLNCSVCTVPFNANTYIHTYIHKFINNIVHVPEETRLTWRSFFCRTKGRTRLCGPLKPSSLSCRTRSKARSKVQRISLQRRNTKRFLSANSSYNDCDVFLWKINFLLYRFFFFFMRKLQYIKIWKSLLMFPFSFK